MTTVGKEFAQYCCELLSTAGPCVARRMFGGYGISTDGLTIAILVDFGRGEELRLIASPETTSQFEAAGCERFTYLAKGKAKSMSYYSAPDAALESAHDMAGFHPWPTLPLRYQCHAGLVFRKSLDLAQTTLCQSRQPQSFT
jgi:DNA transformation protein